ncbi:hypothetical protein RFI_07738 [Reticulomyxa filosa]|uniref:Uncharacterized protein n=1 Tax=Reticulomyxa filosa TaxID=46433 RepID=X6NTU3_RETFI|nr:hypothetical protein RFI_07738 [Reticulomyxa filosa]|eukprot:ETO29381.1 hypothetical protein RFI_07738 [Reticulomyxa filosa]
MTSLSLKWYDAQKKNKKNRVWSFFFFFKKKTTPLFSLKKKKNIYIYIYICVHICIFEQQKDVNLEHTDGFLATEDIISIHAKATPKFYGIKDSTSREGKRHKKKHRYTPKQMLEEISKAYQQITRNEGVEAKFAKMYSTQQSKVVLLSKEYAIKPVYFYKRVINVLLFLQKWCQKPQRSHFISNENKRFAIELYVDIVGTNYEKTWKSILLAHSEDLENNTSDKKALNNKETNNAMQQPFEKQIDPAQDTSEEKSDKIQSKEKKRKSCDDTSSDDHSRESNSKGRRKRKTREKRKKKDSTSPDTDDNGGQKEDVD